MKIAIRILAITAAAVLIAMGCADEKIKGLEEGAEIRLPAPTIESDLSLEETLHARRSIRNYSPEEISLKNLSQILWAKD